MNSILENLSWLPKPPQNFSQKINEAISVDELCKLIKYSLDENQLTKLYLKFKLLKSQDKDILLTPMTIGIVSNATTKLAIPVLIASALRFGIMLEVVESEFNQVAQEAFSKNSLFSDKNLDFIILAIDYRGLPLVQKTNDKKTSNKNIQESFFYIESVVNSLKNKTGAQIIIQNIAPPIEAFFGSYEELLPGTLLYSISSLNRKINRLISENIFLLNISNLASNLGLENWHDPTLWNIAKLPFPTKYLPIYSEYICRILFTKLGKSRRCLILDLDNTLWGGVIGDDGLEGILIGNGDPTGEAHLEVQKTVLELRKRGIVLAVSSKNEDLAARSPFKSHPGMLLR